MTIITANRATLAAALKHGASIIEKSNIPVINNVRLSVARGQAALLFTDRSLWLSVSVEARSDTITAITLPAALFSRTVAAMDGDAIKLAITKAQAILTCGRTEFKLPTIPADQFPGLPEDAFGAKEPAIVSASALASALGSVTYALPSMICNHPQAILFDFVDGDIHLIARDRSRSAHDLVVNGGVDFGSFGLPLKASQLIASLCEESRDIDVTIRTTDRLALFEIGRWQVITAIAEMKTFAYAAVIDERPGDPIIFDPREMGKALDRLGLISDQYSMGIKLELADDTATLSVVNHKSGEASERVTIAYEGDAQTLGYSLPYLRDALRKIPGEEVEMYISSPIKRALITSRDSDGGTHIIGPFLV